jgi:hypothetical protein
MNCTRCGKPLPESGGFGQTGKLCAACWMSVLAMLGGIVRDGRNSR